MIAGLTLASLLLATQTADAGTGTFIELELADPPIGIATGTVAWAISGDGTTVVGYTTSNNGRAPCRWVMGQPVQFLGNLDPMPGLDSALGVSFDGSMIVGGAESPAASCMDSVEAFLWTQSTGMQGLGFSTDILACDVSWAETISDDGLRIGGLVDNLLAVNQPAYHENGSWIGLPTISVPNFGIVPGSVLGASHDGRYFVASGYYGFSPSLGYVYDVLTGTKTDIPALSGGDGQNEILDVTLDGSMVVGRSSSSNGSEAMLWTSASGSIGLGDFEGGFFDSKVNAILSDGTMWVGYGEVDVDRVAAIWEEDLQIQRIDTWLASRGVTVPAGWTLRVGMDIRRVGDEILICGRGKDDQERNRGWLARIPAPGDCPGDATGDNTVDINDLNTVIGNFGNMGAPGIPGDVNDDGSVDINDLNAVLGNFGSAC